MSQRSAAWNLGIEGGPLMVAIIWAVLVPGARRAPNAVFATACVFWGVGFAFLFAAKASLFRRQQWFSFGSRQMTSRDRLMYRVGYALMVVGCVVALPL